MLIFLKGISWHDVFFIIHIYILKNPMTNIGSVLKNSFGHVYLNMFLMDGYFCLEPWHK